MSQLLTFSAALEAPSVLFEPAFAQRATVAVALICVMAAALGPTIVLRDLPFFTHAIGAGAYPALVLAVAIGVSLSAAALIGGLLFAGVLWALTRGAGADGDRRDAITGISVAAALALGAVFAASAASGNSRLAVPPEALLFGSILTIDGSTLITLAAVAAVVAAAAWMFGARWLAGGFDGGVASQLGAARFDVLLLPLIALAAAATLPVTGSLMAGSLLVVPAATARLLTARAALMAPITFVFAVVEGAFGLYFSLAFDLPTGATIAAAAGIGFIVVAVALALVRLARQASLRPPKARLATPLATPLATIALFSLVVTGCGGEASSEQAADDGSINVVATTTQVGDLVRQVGGESVNVTTLLQPGADPHAFEPKPSAVAAIADADVVFRSGGDVDDWLTPAVKAAGNGTRPVDLSNSVTVIGGGGSGDETNSAPESFNAHWYLSTNNLAAAAQRIRDELIKANPTARESLRANANEYLSELDSEESALTACVEKLPQGDRAIMTGHDDFDYMTQQFDLEVTAQLADTGESEPSVKDVQEATDAAREGGAKALVVSRGEVPKLAVEVAKKLEIPLLELYSDSLAKSGPASTALGAVSYNVGSIARATSGGSVSCAGGPTA